MQPIIPKILFRTDYSDDIYLFWMSVTVRDLFWQYWTTSENNRAKQLRDTSPLPRLKGLSRIDDLFLPGKLIISKIYLLFWKIQLLFLSIEVKIESNNHRILHWRITLYFRKTRTVIFCRVFITFLTDDSISQSFSKMK